ncbi:MAG: hypothetical protein HY861_00500 [Chlamydiia bacterium]|nr:hypothetical protein [Chlamydiia bacterium]
MQEDRIEYEEYKVGRWTVPFYLIGSTLATLLLSMGGYVLYVRHHESKLQDKTYRITTILQTGPEKGALKTEYLAELLDLSVDHPISLYAFNCKAAERCLQSSPLIVKAKVERKFPSTVFIDYEVRKPIAQLADYKNVAIDAEGYLFPIHPFFSPQELPQIYLGLPPFGVPEDSFQRKGGAWLIPISNRFFDLAFQVLQFLDCAPWRQGFRIKRIDVANAFAPSLGQREIVLMTEEELLFKDKRTEVIGTFPKLLRLAPKDFSGQLNRFFALRRNMEEDYRKQAACLSAPARFAPRIIDLRIPQLAFVEN